MQVQDERTGFARADLAAMPALEDAPELYRPALAQGDPLTRQDARRDEDFALRAAGQATALTRLLSQAPPEGEPDGMAARLFARFDEESAALLDGAPSPRAEDAARAAIGRARGRFADWALPQEAAAQTVARRQTLIDTLAQFRAAAEQQPDDADGLHAEGATAIAGASDWLGPEGANELGKQWAAEVYSSAGRSWINADPNDAASKLSAGAYAALPYDMRQSLLRDAQQSIVQKNSDGARQRENALYDAKISMARRQEEFANQYLGAIADGAANRASLEDAVSQNRISSFRAESLASALEARDDAAKARRSAVQRVMAYIDGETTERLSVDDVKAHFEEVLKPILEGESGWARGAILASYQSSLGSLPESAESDIRRMLYHADPSRQAEAAELIASLKYNKGDVLFLPVDDLDYAERVRGLVMNGYSPDRAVQLAEEGVDEEPRGAQPATFPPLQSDADIFEGDSEEVRDKLMSVMQDLPHPDLLTTQNALLLARTIAEIAPVTGQAIAAWDTVTALYAASIALKDGDRRKALEKGGEAAFAALGLVPFGGMAKNVGRTTELALRMTEKVAPKQVFSEKIAKMHERTEELIAPLKKKFDLALPGSDLRKEILSKMRGLRAPANRGKGLNYEDQIDEVMKNDFGLKPSGNVKHGSTILDRSYEDAAGNRYLVEVKTKGGRWDYDQKRNQLQAAIDTDSTLVFAREGNKYNIWTKASAEIELERMNSPFRPRWLRRRS
jgi:hypothetical protein